MSIGVFEYFLNFLANREKGVKKHLSAANGGTSPPGRHWGSAAQPPLRHGLRRATSPQGEALRGTPGGELSAKLTERCLGSIKKIKGVPAKKQKSTSRVSGRMIHTVCTVPPGTVVPDRKYDLGRIHVHALGYTGVFLLRRHIVRLTPGSPGPWVCGR